MTDKKIKSQDRVKKFDFKKYLLKNIVTLIFLILCIIGIIVAKQPAVFLIQQILERISRNSFLVLALIIPVIAGLGLNFAIIIGAMAAQIAIIVAVNYGFSGTSGLLFIVLLSTPIAIVFGYLVGNLLNKTRGQEMITSMIVGYFSQGLYLFAFLFLAGGVIEIKNKQILIPGGIGIRNTISLTGTKTINDFGLTSDGLKYSIDGLYKTGIYKLLILGSAIALIYALAIFFRRKIIDGMNLKEGSALYNAISPEETVSRVAQIIKIIIWFVILLLSILVQGFGIGPKLLLSIRGIKFPVVTGILIILVAIFNNAITSTKLGHDFRTVGQDQNVAQVSGIKVDKVRVIAIIISMVLAAWGQIILIQNLGVLNTYGSHMQIGMFSVAALLVGGASVDKATNKQAFLGVLLFHTLFIVSPTAGKNLFHNAQIGEFFRAFVAYGAIGLSLILYAWQKIMENRK